MLQAKYDPAGLHSAEQWLEVARYAVAMVTAARDEMDMVPPASGEGHYGAIR